MNHLDVEAKTDTTPDWSNMMVENDRAIVRDLTPEQHMELQIGGHLGLDVSAYSSREYNAKQMELIRWGLMSGINIKRYASPEINVNKMYIIYVGLMYGIDLVGEPWLPRALPSTNTMFYTLVQTLTERPLLEQKYYNLKAYIRDRTMHKKSTLFNKRQLALFLVSNKGDIDIGEFATCYYDIEQMEQIAEGLKSEVNIELYRSSSFNGPQMEQIRLGMEGDLFDRVHHYAKPHIDQYCMSVIRRAMLKGIDMTRWADDGWDSDALDLIVKGLEKKLDVTLYARKEFDNKQMIEIYRGLVDNMDVSRFHSCDFNHNKMEKRRKRLKSDNSFVRWLAGIIYRPRTIRNT